MISKISIQKIPNKRYNLAEELLIQPKTSSVFEKVLFSIKDNSTSKEFNKLINKKNTFRVSFPKQKLTDNGGKRKVKSEPTKLEKNIFAKTVETVKTPKRVFFIEKVKLDEKSQYNKEMTLLDIAVVKSDKNAVKKILLQNPNTSTIINSKEFAENNEILKMLDNKLKILDIKSRRKENGSLLKRLLIYKANNPPSIKLSKTVLLKNEYKLRSLCYAYGLFPKMKKEYENQILSLLGLSKSDFFDIKEFCSEFEELVEIAHKKR